jgi:hypothetical protein
MVMHAPWEECDSKPTQVKKKKVAKTLSQKPGWV